MKEIRILYILNIDVYMHILCLVEYVSWNYNMYNTTDMRISVYEKSFIEMFNIYLCSYLNYVIFKIIVLRFLNMYPNMFSSGIILNVYMFS